MKSHTFSTRIFPDIVSYFTPSSSCEFIKAHGTQNDFVVINDPQAQLSLTPQYIRAFCDRRAGIGADGLIRIAYASALHYQGLLPEYPEGVEPEMIFMDYYNYDGSLAEICGNGLRVCAHLAYDFAYYSTREFVLGTRAGARRVCVAKTDNPRSTQVRVSMGKVTSHTFSEVQLWSEGKKYIFSGEKITVGNPHLVCIIPPDFPVQLHEWDLALTQWDRHDFPQGVNVEIVYPEINGSMPHAHMRVLERGVGETLSCGSGAVAAAWSYVHSSYGKAHNGELDENTLITMMVPGGELVIQFKEGQAWLSGQSQVVAQGVFGCDMPE